MISNRKKRCPPHFHVCVQMLRSMWVSVCVFVCKHMWKPEVEFSQSNPEFAEMVLLGIPVS